MEFVGQSSMLVYGSVILQTLTLASFGFLPLAGLPNEAYISSSRSYFGIQYGNEDFPNRKLLINK